MDANNKTQRVKVFNKIDYVICRAAQKSILQNARSYGGTEVSSDHRLVFTKIRIERFYLTKKSKMKFDAPIDIDISQRQDVRRKYSEEAVKGMERLQEEFRMFKAAKMLNPKRFENPFVHNKNGEHVSNPEEVHKIIKDHFKCHFYEENIESLPPFTR